MDSILLASSTGRDGDTSQSDHAHVGSVAGAPLARRLIFCPLLMETSASCRRALSLAAPPPLAACCLLLSLLSFSLRRSPFLAFPWCPKRFWGRARGSANARRAKDYGNLALFPSRFFSFVLADWDLLSESRVKGQLRNPLLFPKPVPSWLWPEAYPRGGIRDGGCVLFPNISFSSYSLLRYPYRLRYWIRHPSDARVKPSSSIVVTSSIDGYS